MQTTATGQKRQTELETAERNGRTAETEQKWEDSEAFAKRRQKYSGEISERAKKDTQRKASDDNGETGERQ